MSVALTIIVDVIDKNLKRQLFVLKKSDRESILKALKRSN
ncbi:hypothetical protein QE382_003735 [Sphingobacterium zeae]|uniref:Uncharacterized protein n=1 Tax=Sphingobacterium zeae TaxID=1776859 RepID=A0ABU0UA79_9SPHI|nr:hypothetical protein [Sphingobacterium zeae]